MVVQGNGHCSSLSDGGLGDLGQGVSRVAWLRPGVGPWWYNRLQSHLQSLQDHWVALGCTERCQFSIKELKIAFCAIFAFACCQLDFA